MPLLKYITKPCVVITALLLLGPLSPAEVDSKDRELYLLRGEHYLYINASKNLTDPFHLKFCFPPDYNYQVPILLEIFDDTTADILHYCISPDKNEPNRVIDFTIAPMKKEEGTLLHFSCWVLVKNHEFEDLPKYVRMPKKHQLPKETRTWLVPTKVVQVNNVFIKRKAEQLKGLSNNLIKYAKRVAFFIKYHRYPLFIIQLKLGIFFSQDAVTTLFINGENVGRSHLGCALLRTYDVPARVILAHNDQGFWTQMHYMIEYFCPGYGWVLIDSTKGKTPYATKRQIINRICFPEDEWNTKRDYIFPLMKGEERWLWIDNRNVHPWYKDCRNGSKSQMFTEGNITTDSLIADFAFNLTREVFHNYENYLGKDLSNENLEHFQNALFYQKEAMALFLEKDISAYIYFMNKAYQEYSEIKIKDKIY
jgi:hypothetical protein